MQNDPLRHTAVSVLNADKLSRYGQDDLAQLVFAAREALVELESVCIVFPIEY